MFRLHRLGFYSIINRNSAGSTTQVRIDAYRAAQTHVLVYNKTLSFFFFWLFSGSLDWLDVLDEVLSWTDSKSLYLNHLKSKTSSLLSIVFFPRFWQRPFAIFLDSMFTFDTHIDAPTSTLHRTNCLNFRMS